MPVSDSIAFSERRIAYTRCARMSNSRKQGGGQSLNNIVAKGPDCYINNMAGVLVKFIDRCHAVIGDINKMYNAVNLVPED